MATRGNDLITTLINKITIRITRTARALENAVFLHSGIEHLVYVLDLSRDGYDIGKEIVEDGFGR